jgi:hypothetical protein
MTQTEIDKQKGVPTCPTCPICAHVKDDGVTCPVCDDCDQVCKEKNGETTSSSSSSSSSTDKYQQISGAVAGIVAFMTLAGCTMIIWLFMCRRRAGSGRRGRHQPVPASPHQYDMEMSKPNGAFRDADSNGYSDHDDDDDEDIRPID